MKDWHEQGGSAFPIPGSEVGTNPVEYGMSLRDWFAGQALNALIQTGHDKDGAVEYAYSTADAMLKEREK